MRANLTSGSTRGRGKHGAAVRPRSTLRTRPLLTIMSEVSEAMLQLCGGVWAKGRKDSDGPELEGRLLHVVPQVALHCRLCKGSERRGFVVVG